jgi:kojibiose phosphorylase
VSNPAYDPWSVAERDLCPTNSAKYETIFAQANGYRCLRGASPFLAPAIPGNFIAGIFDKGEAEVPELVNAPNPLPIAVYVDFQSVALESPGLREYTRTFDMKRAVVRSSARFRATTGSELELGMERFVSHGDRGRWAERWTFTALNFSRRILILTSIDGGIVSNRRNPLDAARHFDVLAAEGLGDHAGRPWGIRLLSRTKDSGLELAEAQAMTGSGRPRLVKLRPLPESIEAVWELELREGEAILVDRLGYTCTSRDRESRAFPGGKSVSDGVAEISPRPLLASMAERGLESFASEGYDAEFEAHRAALQALWEKIDIAIDGDDRAQRGLRFNLLQLASCASASDDRSSIGAKGLHGEGYKGHVFWDTETFMMPFFIFTQPMVARNLLGYRIRTLEGARANARASGHPGARFAWESAEDGRETTPRWGVNYAGKRTRIWTGDIEVHIDSDISYAILKYYQVSGDEEFLRAGGLRVLLEIAAFWAGFFTYDIGRGRYELRDVIGPDEFHEHVDNNTYTNYLARWSLRRTLELAERWRERFPSDLARVMEEAKVVETDFAVWREVADKIHVPIGAEGDVLIEQFEGYFKLKEYPIVKWDSNGMPLWPADIDVGRLDGTTLIKQPDVVMLFAMLGEDFDAATKLRNYEFYEARTMHKSSLSPSIYAMVGMSIGKTEHAYDYFMKAIETDLADNQGNGLEGIHAASMGGVWQTAVFGFGGLSVDASGLPAIKPWLPPKWSGMRYRFAWRGAEVRVAVTREEIAITPEREIDIAVEGKKQSCPAGRTTRTTRTTPSPPGY